MKEQLLNLCNIALTLIDETENHIFINYRFNYVIIRIVLNEFKKIINNIKNRINDTNITLSYNKVNEIINYVNTIKETSSIPQEVFNFLNPENKIQENNEFNELLKDLDNDKIETILPKEDILSDESIANILNTFDNQNNDAGLDMKSIEEFLKNTE